METTNEPNEEEFGKLIYDLSVLMDVVAVSLHPADIAGVSGNIMTIFLDEDSLQCGSDLEERTDVIFKKHGLTMPYRIMDIRDVKTWLDEGSLYYLKWYLTSNHLLHGNYITAKMKKRADALPYLKKAIKRFSGMFQRVQALTRAAQQYRDTSNHQLALYSIHQNINLLFGIAGELTLGRPYVNNNVWSQQEFLEASAPSIAGLFDANDEQDKKIAESMHQLSRNFLYHSTGKIKKEALDIAFEKMIRLMKAVREIYDHQLSYCRQKAVTFQPPVYVAELPVKAGRYDKVVSVITKYIDTHSIYRFSDIQTTQLRHTVLGEEPQNSQTQGHSFLLLLTNESKQNAVGELSYILKKKAPQAGKITLLIHNLSELKTTTVNQKAFFNRVLEKGELLYGEKASVPTHNGNSLSPRDAQFSIRYWKDRDAMAANFLDLETTYNEDGSETIQQALLHLGLEHLCLGLIELFMGYHPNHFSLRYLFDLCANFTRLPDDFFPCNTQHDIAMFKLLSSHISLLRYKGLFTTDMTETEMLSRKCNAFYEAAFQLATKEITRLESNERGNSYDQNDNIAIVTD